MVTINFDVEDEIKDRAEEACNDLGLSMTLELKKFLIELGEKKKYASNNSVNDIEKNEAIVKLIHDAEKAEESIQQGNYYTSAEVSELLGV